MLTRTVFCAVVGFLLAGCAAVKPPPAVEAPVVKAFPKLAVTVPDGWRQVREAASEDGSTQELQLIRVDRGVAVGTLMVVARPESGIDVLGTIEQIAQAIRRQGGTTVIGGDPAKAGVSLAFFIEKDGISITGLIVFRPAPSDPSKLIVAEGRWLSIVSETVMPEADGIIDSADLK